MVLLTLSNICLLIFLISVLSFLCLSYDGAEIYQLVGIYIQNKLCKLMNKKDFGLYRDDGLGILTNTSRPEADQKRMSIIKIFKECGLSINCE